MIDGKIHCPVWHVDLLPHVCAIRYRNANAGGAEGWRPGTGDFACRDCKIGRDLAAGKKYQKKGGRPMTTSDKMYECSECGKLKTPKEMGVHPRSGAPWRLCPECRGRKIAAGLSKNSKAVAGPAKKPPEKKSPAAPTCAESAGPTMMLDFTGREHIRKALNRCADREFRDPASQVMWILSFYLELTNGKPKEAQ